MKFTEVVNGRERAPLRLLRLAAVLETTGCRRSAFYNLIRDGAFPKPVTIGGRAVAWPAHEIEAIIAARIAGTSEDEVKTLVRSLAERRAQFAA